MLDKYQGEAERKVIKQRLLLCLLFNLLFSLTKVRELFADAEAEQNAKGDQSQLHVIIFDGILKDLLSFVSLLFYVLVEFDAIARPRGSRSDSTGVQGKEKRVEKERRGKDEWYENRNTQ